LIFRYGCLFHSAITAPEKAAVRYPNFSVSRISPTIEGFRAAFRRPSLTLAEITWRWTVGATTCVLLLFGSLEYLNTLFVSNGDLLFLRTRHPLLVGQAIAHILHGSLSRAVMAGLLGALALTCLWIIAASLGRSATVQALLEYFSIRRNVACNASACAGKDDGGRDAASTASTETSGRSRREESENRSVKGSWPFRSLAGLNFLRAALLLAAILALQGAAILISLASPPANPRPGLAFSLFVLLSVPICVAWWSLNWFLSQAAIFAVRDGEDTLGAFSSAVAFWRERAGAVFAVSTWTGVAHLAAFTGATVVVSLLLSLIRVGPARLAIIGIFLAIVAYMALADWLYMARLAGYICIAGMPDALLAPAALPSPPPSAPLLTTMDRDEPILGDIPTVIVET
jgi:hypothetical protein